MERETGLEPATTRIKIPPQLRCLHPAKTGRGQLLFSFLMSYTKVTQFKVNYSVFKTSQSSISFDL